VSADIDQAVTAAVKDALAERDEAVRLLRDWVPGVQRGTWVDQRSAFLAALSTVMEG